MHNLQRQKENRTLLCVSIWICGNIWLDICLRTYLDWYIKEVKIIQKWDGIRPQLNAQLYDFNVWFADKKLRELNELKRLKQKAKRTRYDFVFALRIKFALDNVIKNGYLSLKLDTLRMKNKRLFDRLKLADVK
jgi:hypothetical protein